MRISSEEALPSRTGKVGGVGRGPNVLRGAAHLQAEIARGRGLPFVCCAVVLVAMSTIASQAAFADAPTVTGFSPASGPPGWSVAISGTGLSTATSVTFAPTGTSSMPEETPFTVQDDGSIVATVPFFGSVPLQAAIIVQNQDGSGSAPTDFGVDGRIALSEARGSVGETVTLTGSGFDGATKVTFGTWPTGGGAFALSKPAYAHFHVLSDTKMTATVPRTAVGRRCCVKVTSPVAISTSGRSTPFLVVKPRLLSDDDHIFAVRPGSVLADYGGGTDIGHVGGHIRWRRWGKVAYGVGTVRAATLGIGPFRRYPGSITASRLRGGRYTRMTLKWTDSGDTKRWRLYLYHYSTPDVWFWVQY